MYQGKAKNQALEQARMALRSVTVYDQFELLGKFDALWLSDSVCDSFARAYATKWGKGAQHTKEFIARQHAENKRTISFYVLYPFDLVPLGFPESFWSVSLCVDGDMRTIYAPLEIRMLDVAPEYQIIFGSLYTRFKQAYLIKFDAMARNDVSLITAHTKRIALVFRSVKKEVFLEWQLSDDNLAAHKRKSSSARRSASWAEEEVYGSGHESKGGKNVRRHAKR